MSATDSKKLPSPPRSARSAAPVAENEQPFFSADEPVVRRGPPALTDTPSVGTLLVALKRRWLLALLLPLCGAALTFAAVCFFVPARYVSEYRLQLRRPPDYMPGATDGVTMDDYIRGQVQILRSTKVASLALNRPQVRTLKMVQAHDEDDLLWVSKDLVIKLGAGDNVVPLKMSSEHPEELVTFLDALVESYTDVLREERKAQLARLEIIQRAEEKELEELARRLPASDPRQLESLTAELRRVRIDLARARTDYEARRIARVEVKPGELTEAVDLASQHDRVIQLLQVKIATIERKIEEIAEVSSLGKRDPRITDRGKLRDQLKSADQELKEAYEPLTKAVEKRLLARAQQDHETDLAKLKVQISRFEDEEKAIHREISSQEGGQNIEMRALEARRKVVEGVRNQTLQTITRIKRDSEMPYKEKGQDVPWVVRLGKPSEPKDPDSAQQLRLAGAGSAATFVLLLFGVAFWEFRSRRAGSPDEVALGLGIPTVGVLPMLPDRDRQAALTGNVPRDLTSAGRMIESVDALRTYLLHALGDGPHVILVTSASPGEGKTSLASQLAASLARAWRKTLLIDGDLRKPAAHRLFDLPGEPGFSDVLRGDIGTADVIRPTAVSRLCLMPAGQWDPHAQQALAQEAVGNIFEHLKEEFDTIIVDSCPVLPVADTLLLGQHVDTVVLSVLKGTSRLPEVYAARQRLAALDIPVIGAVFVGGHGALGGLDIQYPYPAVRS